MRCQYITISLYASVHSGGADPSGGNFMKPKAIIVDIDGTLANIDHRRHFVDPKISFDKGLSKYDVDLSFNRIDINLDGTIWKPDWKSFNEAMEDDTPNKWCGNIISRYSVCIRGWEGEILSQPIDIIYCSGREECYREITEYQITEWVIHEGDWNLFMRPEKDYRPDTVIKREIYENHIKDKYDVLFVIDDRKCVVDMWRGIGLICLQCAEGEF